MNAKKRLLAKAVERKYMADGSDFSFDNHFLIRKAYDKYASVVSDNIRYTIFELAASRKSQNKYGIIGKCLINKSLNYMIAELSDEKVGEFMSKNAPDYKFETNKEYLSAFISRFSEQNKKFSNRDKFVKFVKETYNVDLA